MSQLPPGGLFFLETDPSDTRSTPLESPVSPNSTPIGESPFIPVAPVNQTDRINHYSSVSLQSTSREDNASPNPSSAESSSGGSPGIANSPDLDRGTGSDSSSKGSLRTNASVPTLRIPLLAPAPTALGQPTSGLLGPPSVAQQTSGTGLGISSHRNRGFTAPTAPSPLARASIVPPTSDSEDKSSTESTDEGESSGVDRENAASGSGSGAATVTNKTSTRRLKKVSPRSSRTPREGEGSGSISGDGSAEAGPGPSTMRQRESPPVRAGNSPGTSPKLGRRKERFSLGSPSVSASGISSSFPYPYAMPSSGIATTPGMILRGKTRQGSGSSVGSNLASAISPQKGGSPTDSDVALGIPGGLAIGSPRQRTRSGSFGSAFGSYEGRQRSESGSSHVSRMSLLGLTAGVTGGVSPEKGRGDGLGLGGLDVGSDLSRGGSLRESPGRSRQKARQPSGGSSTLGESPTRSRRFSEFLGPSTDPTTRRMSVVGSSSMGPPRLGPSTSSMIPVSTVSPLNPLPSPWGAAPSEPAGSRTPGMTDSPLTSGAIRLTRVPESVRQSNHGGMDSPASGPTSLSGSLRMTTSPIPESSFRYSMPSIPATPAGTRLPTPDESMSPPDMASSPVRSLPSSPRAQQRGLGRARPLMPPPSAFGPVPEKDTPPLLSAATCGPGAESLQRSASNSSSIGAGDATPVSPPHQPTFSSSEIRRPSPYNRARSSTSRETTEDNVGLGLEMSSDSFGSRMSAGALPRARLLAGRARQVSAQSIDLDALNRDLQGDASRHASMIMQSRKAKMQRWRPGSSGADPSLEDASPVKPPMARASSSSELLGIRLPGDRLAAWKMQSGERRDAEAMIDRAPIVTEVSPRRHPLHRASYGQHEVELSDDYATMPNAMARDPSQAESVNGIEWVDWMDEYKRYKEAKLKSEKPGSFAGPNVPPNAVLADSSSNKAMSPTDGLSVRQLEPESSPRSSLQLAPSKSRSSITDPSQRNRSSSIRSNASTAVTTIPVVKASPPAAIKRHSLTDRSRQASYALTRSQQSQGSGKRKKNISNKMEGWWNAVKSNFAGQSSVPPVSPARATHVRRQAAERPDSPAKVPSLPGSRRGSEQDSMSEHPGAMPIEARPRWLRSTTSHADFGSPSSLSTVPPALAMPMLPAPTQRSSSDTHLPNATGVPAPIRSMTTPAAPKQAVYKPMPSGLETRRRQPQLSLKLEQNPLTYPHHRTTSSASVVSRDAASLWGSGGMSSRHSSGFPSPFASIAPGMTPALTQWDQTTSPMWAPSQNRQVSDGKDGATSSQAGDVSNASVMKLIKHRVAVAKESCDGELREIITAITAFVEGHMHQVHLGLESALEADDDTDQDRPVERLMDAFEADSDTDSGQLGIPIARPRQRSSLSRRGSTSLASSPLKRRDFMPSSFKAMATGAISPDRRRSSAQRPVARPTDIGQRLSRNLNMAVGRSAASSRSTSRSRSPLPGNSVMNYLSTFETDSPVDSGLIQGLQEIITIATDVLDLGLNALIARPAVCQEVIGRVREIGSLWDENPESPGRPWYIRLLLAVAALTRVMDWWGAEKDFWNFDADDDEDKEPLTFVMKPLRDEDAGDVDTSLRLDTSAAARRHQEPPSASTMSSMGGMLSAPLVSRGSSPEVATARPDQTEMMTRVEPTEDLLEQAEHAKTVNIVLELSLGEELIEWANPAWQEVIGGDPEDAIGTPITTWLAPADVEIVANASRELERDDSLTAQARFRLVRITSSSDEEDSEREPGPSYIEFEGIGMLMRDRETGAPSHTMWVIKPVASTASIAVPPETPLDAAPSGMLGAQSLSQIAHILCRICERDIPLWFFEKHNETCNEVHRLEADIAMLNEKLDELKDAISEVRTAIQMKDPGSPAQYHGELVCPSPRQPVENDSATLLVAVQRLQLGQLDEALCILSSTKDISTPSVREETSSDQPQYQGLLSPKSEDRLTMAARWVKPEVDDPGLSLIMSDLEDLVRQKHMSVNRMRNTILYSERVRQEWEDKMQRMMVISEESSGEGSSGPEKSEEETELSPGLDRVVTPVESNVRRTSGRSAAPPGRDRRTSRRGTRHASLGDGPIGRLTTPDSGLSSRSPSADAHLSPKPQSTVPASKTAAPSIKDFDIIKPISRGAFGSVYLAKKRATGDYFAIKALKKSDMIAKNQITNVKAERTILMNQASSPYVAKLFFSFQNKDYLYLVMEYLNGGDCAALIKTLGGLPEDWARNYIAEVVLGLEYLHERRIVHRDLKPDNLLIDAHGHLKLTDFGLSRIGLLNRQVGGPRPAYLKQASLHRVQKSHSRSPHSGSLFSASPASTPDGIMSRAINGGQGYFGSRTSDVQSADESSGSESMSGPFPKASEVSTAGKTRDVPKFVGTPDYLCPESILGIGADDDTVDWWALGVVLYEFIYGFPPFHAETPEKVFDNIISRRINWYEEEMEVSAEGRDLMERLMCSDPGRRLGRNGAAEVKAHAFFAGVDWNTIATVEANFVPNVSDPENTEYFDARGAVPQVFEEDSAVSPLSEVVPNTIPLPDTPLRMADSPVPVDDKTADEFGQFTFKNLPVLKQANDEVIRKLRSDQIIPSGQSMTVSALRDRRLSQVGQKRRSKVRPMLLDNMPPSPAPSTASSTSTPSQAGGQPRTPATATPELSALESLQRSQSQPFPSLPSTLAADATRKLSGSSSLGAVHNRAVDVLVAEDNPISQKILATLLTRMGCRCVCVNDGAEALAATMGDIRFDLMIFDLVMPNVSGEEAARMIRSTNNPNADTPIIAATSYEHKQTDIGSGAIFSAVLAKPITKKLLAECFQRLGFVLGSVGGLGASGAATAVGKHQPKHGDVPPFEGVE